MTRDEARDFVRAVAMSLPPSDFGSTRAINAMADAIVAKFLPPEGYVTFYAKPLPLGSGWTPNEAVCIDTGLSGHTYVSAALLRPSPQPEP